MLAAVSDSAITLLRLVWDSASSNPATVAALVAAAAAVASSIVAAWIARR